MQVIDSQNTAINSVLEDSQEGELLQKYIQLKKELHSHPAKAAQTPQQPRLKEVEMSQLQINQLFSQNESSKQSILSSLDCYVRKVNLAQLLKTPGSLQL